MHCRPWEVWHSLERNRETLDVGQNLAFSSLLFCLIMKSLILSWWHNFTPLLQYLSLHVLRSFTIFFVPAVFGRCQVGLGWENRRKQWDVVSYSFGDGLGWLKRERTQNNIWSRTAGMPKVTKWCYHVVSWLELTMLHGIPASCIAKLST